MSVWDRPRPWSPRAESGTVVQTPSARPARAQLAVRLELDAVKYTLPVVTPYGIAAVLGSSGDRRSGRQPASLPGPTPNNIPCKCGHVRFDWVAAGLFYCAPARACCYTALCTALLKLRRLGSAGSARPALGPLSSIVWKVGLPRTFLPGPHRPAFPSEEIYRRRTQKHPEQATLYTMFSPLSLILEACEPFTQPF